GAAFTFTSHIVLESIWPLINGLIIMKKTQGGFVFRYGLPVLAFSDREAPGVALFLGRNIPIAPSEDTDVDVPSLDVLQARIKGAIALSRVALHAAHLEPCLLKCLEYCRSIFLEVLESG